jgi:hypothetical protein
VDEVNPTMMITRIVLGMIFVIFSMIYSGSARAEDFEWSFETHPVIPQDELDFTYEDVVAKTRNTNKIPCRAYEELAYAAYRAKYPDFEPMAHRLDMVERWLEAELAIGNGGYCHYSNLSDDILENSRTTLRDELLFCGNVSRKARDAHEEMSIRAFELLLRRSMQGDQTAIKTLLDLEFRPDRVRLDPRVRQYLLIVLEPSIMDMVYSLGQITREENRAFLTEEDRRFVADAAERRDLKAILDILPPCR